MLLDRYLIREIFVTFVGVSAVLLLIFISGQLVSLYTEAAAGGLNASVIFLSLGYETVSNLVFVLPLSFYLSILLALSRLYQDNEIVVLNACGISQWRLLKPILMLGLAFMLVVAALSLYLAPLAQSKSDVLIERTQQRADVAGLTPGRFRELSVGEGVVYVRELSAEEGRLKNLFVRQRDAQNDAVITADSGYRQEDPDTGQRFLVLEDGYRYEGRPDRENYTIIEFAEHGVRLQEEEAPQEINLRQKALPSWTLWQRARSFDIAELQWRFSVPALTLILAIMAVPLSRTSPRQGRYAKLAIALLIYIIYSNLLNVSRAWLNKGEISPYIGMWWVHLVALLLALMLLMGWRGYLRRLLRRR